MFPLLFLLLALPLPSNSFTRTPFALRTLPSAVMVRCPITTPLCASVIPYQGSESNVTVSSSSASDLATSSPVDVDVPLFKTLWSFTRPHTFIGTMLTLPSLLLRLSSSATDALLLWRPLLLALLPALLSNAYITGVNQITDQAIDAINKPTLPLPSGALRLSQAKLFVSICLLLSTATSLTNPVLFGTVALCNLIGTAYSLPPVRLKRSPWGALFCVSAVRGLVINLGFTRLFAGAVLGPGATASAWAPALYFTLFGAVIAVFKDVPDVAGDDYPTFAKRFGKMETLHACRQATVGLVAAPSLWMLSKALSAPAALGSSTKLFLALLGAWTAKWFWTFEGAGEEAGVKDEYMRMWKIFYGAYLVLPWYKQ